jgi:hypothetical protein
LKNDKEKEPMVLKLKDWPPGEDFRDMMPSRYAFRYRLSELHPSLGECQVSQIAGK